MFAGGEADRVLVQTSSGPVAQPWQCQSLEPCSPGRKHCCRAGLTVEDRRISEVGRKTGAECYISMALWRAVKTCSWGPIPSHFPWLGLKRGA